MSGKLEERWRKSGLGRIEVVPSSSQQRNRPANCNNQKANGKGKIERPRVISPGSYEVIKADNCLHPAANEKSIALMSINRHEVFRFRSHGRRILRHGRYPPRSKESSKHTRRTFGSHLTSEFTCQPTVAV